LEFGASVGFIHKESVTMHGHTILKVGKLLQVCIKPHSSRQISVITTADYGKNLTHETFNVLEYLFIFFVLVGV
jgi:hypothetical protein